jgi:hypothetical protein
MANLDKMDANQHNMEATIRGGQEETIKSITGACRESMDVSEEKTKALPETTEACPEMTHACLEEEEEQTPEEMEAMEKPQDVPIGATDEEAIRATEDRAGELRLVLRHRRQEEMGPGQWWARPWTSYPPCRPCNVQGACLQGTG